MKRRFKIAFSMSLFLGMALAASFNYGYEISETESPAGLAPLQAEPAFSIPAQKPETDRSSVLVARTNQFGIDHIIDALKKLGQALPLNPGTGEDLVVDHTYYVDKGTYQYGFIHIVKGGSLIFRDADIDFWARSILVENGGSLMVGSSENPIGSADINHVITFHLYGAETDPGITCKESNCGVPDAQWTSNPTAKSSLPGGCTDYFYQYERLPADDKLGTDAYFGGKVLAVSYGGTLQMFGKKGATYGNGPVTPSSGTSWARLNQSATEGDTILILDRSVDWQVGDQIVVTATDYLPDHSEVHTIKSIQAQGEETSITLQKALRYPHNGEKYDLTPHKIPDSLQLNRTDVDTRAAVALLSRNIRIISEGSAYNTALPADSYFGGHTIARQGFQSFQMQGVEFYQLGQGGRMAHSPVNFHLTRQTPPDTFVKDCSVWDSMTRWVELRGTQGVLLERNVGYRSIGHGYFLAEGSETHNRFLANIGIYARPALDYRDNPRQVPGCIAMAPNDVPANLQGDLLAVAGDYVHPSVFLIMNGFNDFEDNMAVGAGACGACYWLAPCQISGLSAGQSWEGYAGIQKITPGTAPLKRFKGNFCSTAQQSLITIGTTGTCEGVSNPTHMNPDALQPVSNPFSDGYNNQNLYPVISAGAALQANWCDEATDPQCNSVAKVPCQKGRTENCAVTVIEDYTSSFHWAQQNFATIWLRTNWFLFTDSALTDVLNGGLTMVSGGSYDQVVNKYWALTQRSVFVGHTQENNPYATNAGPISTGSPLQCLSSAASYCLPAETGVTSKSDTNGTPIPIDNFSVYQRLYDIYDGPVYQHSNAYVNILETPVDCTGNPGTCESSPYMYGPAGRGMGIPRAKEGPHKGKCILPNAAIGWKQPNGFYYPPAFHSENLYFDDDTVDLRHFIIIPLFTPGTNTVDEQKVKDEYCTYPGDPGSLFDVSFTDVDRQTELNDDDGSVSGLNGADPDEPGLIGTIAVNNDDYFLAPTLVHECLSEQTCYQSPYDYVSAVVFPQEIGGQWSQECTDRTCYGVPIYRQYLTTGEAEGPEQSIRMMGASIGQRSSLVANNGLYYIDTAVSADQQSATNNKNVFEGGKTYNVFLIYAKQETHVTFQLYVGDTFSPDQDLRMVRVGTSKDDGYVLTSPIQFNPVSQWPAQWTQTYNNGILEVTMDLSAFQDDFDKALKESCGPSSFCTWDDTQKKCIANTSTPGTNPIDYQPTDDICRWSIKAVECPSGGCFGFQVDLPADFSADGQKHRPEPEPYPDRWDVTFKTATGDVAGRGACYYPTPPETVDWAVVE
ncbi:MAG: G8 domain-containing protein [Deltaproteobacteria bacterium]|nr:G8 domain-containing protein [Deltaproteobacteria bacterium]